MRSFFTPIRPLLRGWLLSAIIWGGLALAFGWQLAGALDVAWADALAVTGRDWLAWTLITPLSFRLARRLPIERSTWRITLPAHVALGVLFLVAIGIWGRVIGPQSLPLPVPPELVGKSRGAPEPPGVSWLIFGPHLPLYLAVVSGAHALCFYRRAQEREHRSLELTASLSEARLQALRMQIQPHFLFNSLNALAGLIHRDPDAADQMLVELSTFLRLTLQSPAEQLVPLARELEFAKSYLAVEQVRFGPRLRYRIDAEAESLAAFVPTLLLQPLVENAVRHGIEPLPTGGCIVISSRRNGDSLLVAVRDTGSGRRSDSREGVGLANTRARLHELYGDAGTLTIRSEAGTNVEVRLPLRHQAQT